jgi:hypothetical protein
LIISDNKFNMEYSVARLAGEPSKEDYDYDWTFMEQCDVHGALPDEIWTSFA